MTLRDAFAHAHDGVSYFAPARILDTASTMPPTAPLEHAERSVLRVRVLCTRPGRQAGAAGVRSTRSPPLSDRSRNDTKGLPLISYPRYVLVVFPLFLAVAAVLARSRVAVVGWTVASAVVGVYLTILFTSWRWVA